MSRFYGFLVFLLIVALIIGVVACQSGPTTPTTPGNGTSPTAGQLAEAGTTVFANNCARCHGSQGEGVTAPPIIGSAAGLQKYNTAKGLFDYIRTAMPMDAPGSLTQQQYQQVLAYLLVENNFVPASSPLDVNRLDAVPLTR